MAVVSRNGEELCEEERFVAKSRKYLKNPNNIFLFLEVFLHFCLIEFFLDSKHTELSERNYVYWGNVDDLQTQQVQRLIG